MWRFASFLIVVLVALGCDRPDRAPNFELIAGRDDGIAPYTRPLLYRMQVPSSWERCEVDGSLVDSRLPICEFVIEEGATLYIHNFPGSGPIPPGAQVARWKRQFDHLDVAVTTVTPQAFGGFVGLRLEAEGEQEGKNIAVIGWAMEPAPDHRAALSDMGQRGADYTIKVVGPPDLVEMWREKLIAVAHTFELIEEIPSLL